MGKIQKGEQTIMAIENIRELYLENGIAWVTLENHKDYEDGDYEWDIMYSETGDLKIIDNEDNEYNTIEELKKAGVTSISIEITFTKTIELKEKS